MNENFHATATDHGEREVGKVLAAELCLIFIKSGRDSWLERGQGFKNLPTARRIREFIRFHGIRDDPDIGGEPKSALTLDRETRKMAIRRRCSFHLSRWL